MTNTSSDQDEIPKLLALLVRLQLGNQSDTIIELDRIGFGASRIAQLVGTTRNTANVTIQKNRKRTKTKAAKASSSSTAEL